MLPAKDMVAVSKSLSSGGFHVATASCVPSSFMAQARAFGSLEPVAGEYANQEGAYHCPILLSCSDGVWAGLASPPFQLLVTVIEPEVMFQGQLSQGPVR